MARTKTKPAAKKVSPSKRNISTHSNNNNNLDYSSNFEATKTLSENETSSRRKSTPRRRTVVEEKRQNYTIKRFGKLETIPKKTYKSIQFLQRTTHTIIPKLPFARLIHELILKYNTSGLRIQARALEALQEAAELHIVDMFAASNLAAAHAHRKTVRCNDFFFVRTLFNWHLARS